MASQVSVIVPKRLPRTAAMLLCLIALQGLLLASCQAELTSPVPAFVPINR